jgi:hypothetical protein
VNLRSAMGMTVDEAVTSLGVRVWDMKGQVTRR